MYMNNKVLLFQLLGIDTLCVCLKANISYSLNECSMTMDNLFTMMNMGFFL